VRGLERQLDSLDRIDDILVPQHHQVLHHRPPQITLDHRPALPAEKERPELRGQLLGLIGITLRDLANEVHELRKTVVRLVRVGLRGGCGGSYGLESEERGVLVVLREELFSVALWVALDGTRHGSAGDITKGLEGMKRGSLTLMRFWSWGRFETSRIPLPERCLGILFECEGG
jgi:hypothetical protein